MVTTDNFFTLLKYLKLRELVQDFKSVVDIKAKLAFCCFHNHVLTEIKRFLAQALCLILGLLFMENKLVLKWTPKKFSGFAKS